MKSNPTTEGAPTMPSFVVVNTVNTPLNRQYDFGVHAAGCADLKRGAARNCPQYPHTAPDAEAVVQAERDDLSADFDEEGAGDGFAFRVFPCCG